jgi:hypothetical protein
MGQQYPKLLAAPVDVVFRLHSINFNSAPQTGENS